MSPRYRFTNQGGPRSFDPVTACSVSHQANAASSRSRVPGAQPPDWGTDGGMARTTEATKDGLQRYLDEIGRVALLRPSEEIALARTIESGFLAEAELDRMHANAGRVNSKRRDGVAPDRARRASGKKALHRGEPPAGRVDSETAFALRHTPPRSHPGRESGSDQGGREVRLPEGLQVLDVRELVDTPGHSPGDRRQGTNHPSAGARRRVPDTGGTSPQRCGEALP
ncbi:MAG: hypothetical protein DYH08_18310 [Actinobacteria bacterium ATB1]|nr:hypothetical protein [Actinobacteria bacterium ATB1]